MGSTIWTDHMASAVAKGMVNASTVTKSARRGMRQLLKAGRFDPADTIAWSKLGVDDINSTFAQRVSREAAMQGMIMLKNDKATLPLKAGSAIAVLGPMGVNTDLMSDYAGGTGEAGCWPNSDASCIKTIAEAIADANVGGTTTMAKGVDVNSKATTGIAAAVALAQAADVIVLVIGNDRSVEHEGQDRPDSSLSGLQQSFSEQILALGARLGKPTVVVMSNGGALAIDTLVKPAGAIVEAFNPAQQAPALASLLFGEENRWGKLPLTMYPHSFTSEKNMTDYDMSSGVGRTYRYYTGAPALFAFGTGLSYTTFDLQCAQHTGGGATGATGVTGVTGVAGATGGTDDLVVKCDVTNTGEREGDEVVMMFHSAGDAIRKAADYPVPLKSLIGFDRVRLAAGEKTVILFTVAATALELTQKDGTRAQVAGERQLLFSNGAGQESKVTIRV